MMATLDSNSGQDGCSTKENGNALPEKPHNLDDSEDLWLANSEDLSGPYAKNPNKVVHQVSYSQAEDRNSYPDSFHERHSMDQHIEDREKSGYQQLGAGNDGQHLWSDGLPESGGRTLQPAVHYLNGYGEQNDGEFQSDEGKDFVQLVPAGSYLENGGMLGVDNNDKTFTSLMPAAAVGTNEDEGEYSAMIDAHRHQMAYYSSDGHIKSEAASPSNANHDNIAIAYSQSRQMSSVNGEESENGEAEPNSVYSLNLIGQPGSPTGNFTLLSPAVIQMSNGSNQLYSSHLTACNYQHISSLPFVQNNAFSTQTFHSAAASAISNSDGQHHEILHQSDYSSTHTNFNSADGTALTVRASLAPSLHPSAEDYNEDDEEDDDYDDDDDEANQDMEENSGDFSGFLCSICNESFIDQVSLDDHLNNHPPVKTFLCETCSKGFATRRYLKYHRKNHCKRAGSYEGRNELDENDPNGEIKKFTCNICNRLFRVLKCMKVHKKKKHGILKEYTCPNCAVTFNSTQEITDHPCESKGLKVAPQIPQCTLPPIVFPSKKKRKLKNARPTCDICGKTFSDRISVDIHRVKHIEEELCPCDMCCDEDNKASGNHYAVHFRIRFFTDDNQHILEDQKAAATGHDVSRSDDGSNVSMTPVHVSEFATSQSTPETPIHHPPTYSSGTPANSSITSDYMAGVVEYHPEGDHGQTEITQKYTNLLAMSQHEEGSQAIMVSITKANQSNCLSSSLPNQRNIETHQQDAYNADFTDSNAVNGASSSATPFTPRSKKPKDSKLHLCEICNKSFADPNKLELHFKTNHVDDRPYQCEICVKSFFTKWKLQRHTLSHLEQKPHSCPMCSKSFVERGKLDAHYRTHLGTKPYKCDQCPKTFTVKSQLSIHQRRIHSTDQPFACLVCGKAFLWKSGLDKHMRKHTREKPYICETCGVKYSNKANLIVHMSKSHNQTYTDKNSP